MKGVKLFCISLFAIVYCNAQNGFNNIRPFITNIAWGDSLSIPAICKEILKISDRTSIIVLSEDHHGEHAINKVRSEVMYYLMQHSNFNNIYCEIGLPDVEFFKEIIAREYYILPIDRVLLCDSNYRKEELQFYESNKYHPWVFLPERNYTQIFGIDIGLNTGCIAQEGLLRETREMFEHVARSTYVDSLLNLIRFADPIYLNNVISAVPTKKLFIEVHGTIKAIIFELEKCCPKNGVLLRMWQNLALALEWSFGRPPFTAKGKEITPYIMSGYYKFRDSVMAANFKWWDSINRSSGRSIIGVSTYHSLSNAEKYKELQTFIAPGVKTMGEYLDKLYSKDSISRIAIIALKYSKKRKRSLRKKGPVKESLEWYLGKHYQYAFVNFKALRQDPQSKDLSFYMSPTVYEYLLLPWHKLLDGVIFIRNVNKMK